MLTEVEYTNFIENLSHNFNNLHIDVAYNDYVNYEELWQNYIVNSANLLTNSGVSKIGLIAMESAPGSVNHPHPNYIFHQTNQLIGTNGDSYLKNIFNGAHLQPGLYHNGLTKQQCLDSLLLMSDFQGELRPVILFDLLPTHGITLDSNMRNAIANRLFPEVEINYKIDFIQTNLLNPLGINWSNINFNYACPPTTINPPSFITGHLINYTNGININPTSINTIGNGIAPSQNELRNYILQNLF